MADRICLLGVKGRPAHRPGSNMPTSILISINDHSILIDAGLWIAKSLCDQSVALTEIDDIFITH